MPVSLEKQVGQNRRTFSVYTTSELDRMLNKFNRLTERGNLGGSSGGSSSGSSSDWDLLLNKPTTASEWFTEIGASTRLQNLTDSEVTQLENIGSTTISAAQWGLVGGLDAIIQASNPLLSSSTPEFAGLTLTGDASFSSLLDHPSFAAGFAGSNWRLTSAGKLTLQELLVRGPVTAYEAIINRVRFSFGDTILGAGGGKVSSITGTTGSETIVFEDPEGNAVVPVAAGDVMFIQDVDVDSSTIVKTVWRKVSSITGTPAINVNLTKDADMPADVGSLEVGDEFVVVGNDGTTADRDQVIWSSVTDSGAPHISTLDNITSYTDWINSDKITSRLGKLDGLPVMSDGTQPTGVGLFGSNIFLDATISASDIGSFFGVPDESALQGWFAFDDSTSTTVAVDGSPSGNDATINGATYETSPISGKALDFDGASDYVQLSSSFTVSAGDRKTINIWFDFDVFNGSNAQGLFKNSSVAGFDGYLDIQNNSGTHRVIIENDAGGGFTGINFPSNLSSGTNYMLTLVFDEDGIHAYLNGEFQGSTSGFSGTLTIDRIGQGYGGDWHDGMIDEVRLYSKRLPVGLIQDLYDHPDGSRTTHIAGDFIRSGTILSNNWTGVDGAKGTMIDLDSGIIQMRHGSADIFNFNASTATAKLSGFTASSDQITGDGSLFDNTNEVGRVSIFNDNTNAGGSWAGTPRGVPTIAMFQTNDGSTTNRVFAHMGETYSAGWTGRFGFSLTPSKSASAYFEMSRDMTSGALTSKIGGFNFTDSKLTGGNTVGEYTGIQSGAGSTKTFFAGADDANGTNATAYITADGHIIYDAMAVPVYIGSTVASFGTNNVASSLTDSAWVSRTTSPSTGSSDTEDNTIIRARYYHRFGLNKIIVNGFARRDENVSGSPGYQRDHRIRATINGHTDEVFLTNDSYQEFTLELDLGSTGANLSKDTYYVLTINVYAFVEKTSGTSTDTVQQETYLREDVFATAVT